MGIIKRIDEIKPIDCSEITWSSLVKSFKRRFMENEKIIFWDIVEDIDLKDLNKLYGTTIERYSLDYEEIANKYPEEYDKEFDEILIDQIDVYKDRVFLYNEGEVIDFLSFEQFQELLAHKEIKSKWREYDVCLYWSNEEVL